MEKTSRHILSDFVGFLNVSPQMLMEAEQQRNGRLIIQGVLQRAEAKNQNGRIYPKPLLEREAQRFKQKIESKLSSGELDHPDSPVVNLKNASHAIRELWWDGNDLKGKVEVLSTPSGNIVRELIRSDIQIGISSRGMGSTRLAEDGNTVEIQDDYEIITWDIVSNPSTHGAFLSPVNESIEHLDKSSLIYRKMHAIITDIISLEI